MLPNFKLKYKGNVFCFLPCEGTFASLPMNRGSITNAVR